MFRQSVRQAMKGIAVELERMQSQAVTPSNTCQVAARIGHIVQLIATVMQKVHQVSSVGLLQCHQLASVLCKLRHALRFCNCGAWYQLASVQASCMR